MCEHPRERLRLIYDRILRVAVNFPKDYVYRKAVEDLARERKNIVEQVMYYLMIFKYISESQGKYLYDVLVSN